MPIEVIGAGLGRTGTLSLKAALEELGFAKCYHMVEVFARRTPRGPGMPRCAASQSIGTGSSLATGRPSTYRPACSTASFSRSTPERKSSSRCAIRSAGHDSIARHSFFAHNAFPTWAAVLNPRMRAFRRMIDRLWDRMFQDRFEDRAFAIAAFNRHNEEVRRDIPADRLLVYEISQGWEPLCAFLGLPVPEGKPFPHLNDAAEFRARIERGARIVRTIGYAALARPRSSLSSSRWWRSGSCLEAKAGGDGLQPPPGRPSLCSLHPGWMPGVMRCCSAMRRRYPASFSRSDSSSAAQRSS